MTDLSQFSDLTKAQEEGIDVPILHPKTGDEMGIVVRVAGPDSARQRKARAAVNNERLSKQRNKKPTVADLESDAIKVTAASVISWKGIEENGKAVDYSTEAAEDIFKRHPWLYEQVASAVGDRAVFIKS